MPKRTPSYLAVTFARPKRKAPPKRALTLRLDADVVKWVRGWDGYNRRINAMLLEAMIAFPVPPKSKRRQKKQRKRQSKTDWARVDALRDEEIDLSDNPEVTPEMFANVRPAQTRASGKQWARSKQMSKRKDLVKVVYWVGTTLTNDTARTYSQAMHIAGRSSNECPPTFFELSTGKKLVDDGNGLCYEDDPSTYVC